MEDIFQSKHIDFVDPVKIGSAIDVVFDFVSPEVRDKVVHAKAGCGSCTRNLRITKDAVEATFMPDENPGKGQTVGQTKYITVYLSKEGVDSYINNSKGHRVLNTDALPSIPLSFTVSVEGR